MSAMNTSEFCECRKRARPWRPPSCSTWQKRYVMTAWRPLFSCAALTRFPVSSSRTAAASVSNAMCMRSSGSSCRRSVKMICSCVAERNGVSSSRASRFETTFDRELAFSTSRYTFESTSSARRVRASNRMSSQSGSGLSSSASTRSLKLSTSCSGGVACRRTDPAKGPPSPSLSPRPRPRPHRPWHGRGAYDCAWIKSVRKVHESRSILCRTLPRPKAGRGRSRASALRASMPRGPAARRSKRAGLRGRGGFLLSCFLFCLFYFFFLDHWMIR